MNITRLCSLCKESPARNQDRGGYCADCSRVYGRQNYKENKQRYYDNAKIRNEELDIFINQQKDKPCADCGRSYPHYVMDFDHRIPQTKEHNISRMRRRKMAFATIAIEIQKCDVVCSNCH